MDFPPASPPHNHDAGITAPRVDARTALAALSRAAVTLQDIDLALLGLSKIVIANSNLAGHLSGAVTEASNTLSGLLGQAAVNADALAQAQFDLDISRNETKHWKDLAGTESRLRIEDAERHKAEIARLTAAPVEITDKGRAAVATAPKRLSKPAVVLDPDGHPVSNQKPGTKKAR